MIRARIRKETDKSIAKSGFSRFLFYFVQFTWGLSVNLIGGIVFLILLKKYRHERFKNAFVTYVPGNWGGVSLGLFIFMADKKGEGWTQNTKIHEYGHTIQCLFLGPFYWIIIALPSVVWCNLFRSYREKNKASYYKLYCESWANSLGVSWSGMKQYGIK